MSRDTRPTLSFAAAVLAGGAGTRLHPWKPLLKVGGVPIVVRILRGLSALGADAVVVTGEPEAYRRLGAACVSDVRPGCGPLGGILTALLTADTERVLVVAGDLPFLEPDLLAAITTRDPWADCVVPEWAGRLEPLHAIYRRTCLQPIVEMLDRGQTCPLDLFPQVRTRVYSAREVCRHDPAGRSFFSVNTPADLRRAEREADASGGVRWSALPHVGALRGPEATVDGIA